MPIKKMEMKKQSRYNLGINNFWLNFTYYACSLVLKATHKIHLEGLENIPKEGAALILPKHHYEIDIPLTTILIKEAVNRKAHFIMKQELAKGIFGRLLIKCGAIPINRENILSSIQELKYARKKIEEGNLLVVYPEGKRVNYKMGEINPEILKLWQKYDIPFIPVGIEYRRRDIYLRAGKAIENKNIPASELADIVRKEIARLSNLNY